MTKYEATKQISEQLLQNIVSNFKLDNKETTALFISTQQAALERFSEELEKEINALEGDLKNHVVEMSGKISVRKQLLNDISRQLGSLDAIKEIKADE